MFSNQGNSSTHFYIKSHFKLLHTGGEEFLEFNHKVGRTEGFQYRGGVRVG